MRFRAWRAEFLAVEDGYVGVWVRGGVVCVGGWGLRGS